MTLLEDLKTLHAYNVGDKSKLDAIDEALVNELSAKLVDEHLPRIIELIEWIENHANRHTILYDPEEYRNRIEFAKQMKAILEGVEK